ncbi:AMP-binding protein, partial [Streptomyces sp. SID5998]|nr:AMP-binding protein [Streptomyces sp. SID5998]
PRPRTEAMIADAEVALTVGDAKLLDSAALTGPVLALPEEPLPEQPLPGDEFTDGADAVGGADASDPDRAAFIMFTSGSTGRPKGV